MPRKKPDSTLQSLCLKMTLHHIKELQDQAIFLPTWLIENLYNYKETHLRYDRNCSKCRNVRLPPHVFFHPNLTNLRTDNVKFDLWHTEIAINIIRNCKKLRQLELSKSNWIQADLLLPIIRNNPLITYIDLYHCKGFCDEYLRLTCKYCPQLQYLSMELISDITDECIDYLPIDLRYLNINNTLVTPDSCVLALKRLKYLKQLKHHNWIAILNLLLMLQQSVESTFAIESLEICKSSQEFCEAKALEMFPKLCDIGVVSSNEIEIMSLVEYEKGNLITYIDLRCERFNTIQYVGQFCPMLKELCVRFSFRYPISRDDDDIIISEHVPFKHLIKLEIIAAATVPVHDYKILFVNCKKLQSLHIRGFLDLGDRELYDLLEENSLQRLQRIQFYRCHRLTLDAIIKLLNSLDFLNLISIHECENITDDELGTLEELIDKMNWDLKLDKRLF